MSFDRLLEFLGKQLECCCAMTILGNMKTVGSNILNIILGNKKALGPKKYICNLSMKAVKVHPVTLPLSGSSPEGPKLQLNNSSS